MKTPKFPHVHFCDAHSWESRRSTGCSWWLLLAYIQISKIPNLHTKKILFWSSLQCSWLKRMFGKNHFWLRLLSEKHSHNLCETFLHPKSLVYHMFKASLNVFWQSIGKTWNQMESNKLATTQIYDGWKTSKTSSLPETKNPPPLTSTTLAPITIPQNPNHTLIPLAPMEHLQAIHPNINARLVQHP